MSNNQVNNQKKAIAFEIDFDNLKNTTVPTNSRSPNNIKPSKQEVIPNYDDPKDHMELHLYQCPNCSRKFKREAYAKHVPICASVFHGQREPEINKNNTPVNQNNKAKFNKKSKWENQSSELRAIIQSKRAEIEKDKNDNNMKKNKLKLQIDSANTENYVVNTCQNIQPNRGDNFNRLNYTKNQLNNNSKYIECDMCRKKFTKINYDCHLFECKQKFSAKKNGMTFNKPNLVINEESKNLRTRQPIVPAVTYGAFSSKPNFNLKFGKH